MDVPEASVVVTAVPALTDIVALPVPGAQVIGALTNVPGPFAPHAAKAGLEAPTNTPASAIAETDALDKREILKRR